MGKVKEHTNEQLDKLLWDYAECKIEMNEYIAGITANGIQSSADIQEWKDNAEEARYDHKVSQYNNKF